MYAPIPDGEVKILRGVPLDLNYINTIYFASSGVQSAYFAGLMKYSYDHLYYVRQTERVQVPITADSLFDCNYIMYRNQQYVNKWFYAFITQVYYVNDNNCEIEFEIDVMQTYAFDYLIKPSFIERNHTVTDVIGENDVAENLDIGTYEVQGVDRFSHMGTSWDVVMFSTFDQSWQPSGGTLIGCTYSGLERTAIGRFTTAADGSSAWVHDARPNILNLIQNHADMVDGVVAIVITPAFFESNASVGWTFNKKTAPAGISYTIRNKKLLTAPFYAIYVSDGSGSGKMYSPDKFQATSTCKFNVISDNAPAQSVIATPENYKRQDVSSLDQDNDTEALIMTGFPQVAWVSDSFKQFLAQNQSNLALSSAIGLGQFLGGAAITLFTEGAAAPIGIGMMTGGLSSVAGIVADVNDKSKLPPQTHGNVTGTAFMRTGNKTFIAYHLMPDHEHIRIIDDYFDMYGYAIHKVDVPNISSRPHWNYVKLQNANIIPAAGSGVNATHLKKIADIFNRGITFWKNGSEVGNYNLDNRPLI